MDLCRQFHHLRSRSPVPDYILVSIEVGLYIWPKACGLVIDLALVCNGHNLIQRRYNCSSWAFYGLVGADH